MGEVVIAQIDHNLVIDKVGMFLKDLSSSGFYGVVELQFVNGELVLVREEKTYKPVYFLKQV